MITRLGYRIGTVLGWAAVIVLLAIFAAAVGIALADLLSSVR